MMFIRVSSRLNLVLFLFVSERACCCGTVYLWETLQCCTLLVFYKYFPL
jgi:hypothetical protein